PPRPVVKLDKLGQPVDRTKAGGRPMGGFNKRGGSDTMAFRQALSQFLVKEGAAAIFPDTQKPLGLLVTTASWARGARSSATNRLPPLYVAHNHYELLYRLATRPGSPKTRIELEVSNKFIPGPIKVFNTVGEIKGSERPDEFVVVGAHLDSWDLGNGTT